MGDRISLQFKKGEELSVVLFSHWGGKQFLKEARKYVKELKEEAKKEGDCYPLYRLDPETVMVDFIRHITKGRDRIKSDLYLGKDETQGDNSDNGHFIIDLKKEKEDGR